MRFFVSSLLALPILCVASMAQESAPAPATTRSGAARATPAPAVPKPAEAKAANKSPGAPETAPAQKPSGKPAPAATPNPSAGKPAGAPAPAASPAPQKPGFLDRVFRRKAKATPAPATPAATPAPATPRPRKPRKAVAQSSEDGKPAENTAPASEDASTEKPADGKPATSDVTPAPNENPARADEAATPPAPAPATPAPGKRGHRKGAVAAQPKGAEPEKTLTKEQAAVQQAIAGGDPDAIEKAKYDEAKVRAGEDARVKELKQKADTAPTEEEGRKALRAYNKALFQKMRSVGDESVHDRIDRMEAAIMKDLGQ